MHATRTDDAPLWAGPESAPAAPTRAPATEGLNPQQLEAVTHQGAPLLIMAGAGSGKTRVLTHRVAHLLETGRARPGEILAITFTNKAAAEMRERVQKLVGPTGRRIWVSTFHSACVRMLREHHAAAGLKSTFSIYDQQDSLRLLSMILKDMDVDTKRFTSRFVAGRISDLKNELIGPAQYAREAPKDPVSQLVAAAYTEYQRRLRGANALDFDDLIMTTVQMLQTHPAVAEGFRRRFRHILVDEYQDTNHAQYVLVRELIGDGSDGVPPGELTVVGDSDQSIYAFRGASIRNIEEFEQDYKDARTVFLEQNYRSTQSILDAANSVISKNKGRRPKKLWTEEGAGEKIVLEVGDSEHDEARLVISELDRLSMAGVDWGDIAIFYRANAQSRALEDRLVRAGIPYRIVGGTRFYERAEIKDALAYLQAIVNPDDVVALRRVLNTPRRGIGDKAQAAVAAHAERYGTSFGQALADTLDDSQRPVDGLTPRARAAAADFWSLLMEMRTKDQEGESPATILEDVLARTGYVEQLKASMDPQDASRVDNLAELVSVAEDFFGEWTAARLTAGTSAAAPVNAAPGEGADQGRAEAGTATWGGPAGAIRTAESTVLAPAGGAVPSPGTPGAIGEAGFPASGGQPGSPESSPDSITMPSPAVGLTGVAAEGTPGTPQTPLMGFLERISLVADADQIPDEGQREGQVTMMTVHTAKGLEFPYVFVTGMEDGTFPHKRSMESEAELAEERRLAYVALTRARKRLYLTRAASRSAWGAAEEMPPSRFLDDLPEEIVDVRSQSTRQKLWGSREQGRSLFADSDWGGYADDDVPSYGSGGAGASSGPRRPLIRRDIQRPRTRSSSDGPRSLAGGANDATDPRLGLAMGDRVKHASLGEGVVVGTEGSGRQKVANIQFGSGTKRLLLRVAPVTKI